MKFLCICLLLGGCAASQPSGDMGNVYGKALAGHIKETHR